MSHTCVLTNLRMYIEYQTKNHKISFFKFFKYYVIEWENFFLFS